MDKEKIRKTIALEKKNYVFLMRIAGKMTSSMASEGIRGQGYTLSTIVNLLIYFFRELSRIDNIIDDLIARLEKIDKELPELGAKELITLLQVIKEE